MYRLKNQRWGSMIAWSVLLVCGFCFTSNAASFSTIQCESWASAYGEGVEACSDAGGGQNAETGNDGHNAWATYSNVYIDGATGVDLRYAGIGCSGTVEFRLNSSTGTLLGSVTVSSTGAWQSWTTGSGSISGASGTQTVCLKQTADNLNMNWFKFTGSPSAANYWARSGEGMLSPATSSDGLSIQAMSLFRLGPDDFISSHFAGGQNLTIHGKYKIAIDGPLLAVDAPVSVSKDITCEGMVSAQSVRINDWTIRPADFVFEPDHRLKKLSDVEKFVTTNKHLPGMPSGAEMKKNGIDVVKMNMALLEKVEELVLYTIQQDKRIEALEKKLGEEKK
jgi:hypothetical protein